MRDTEAVAKAKLALGQQLAAWRRNINLTQEALATEVKYARSSIANIETGKQLCPREFWERADNVVGANGILLASFDELDQLRRRQHRPSIIAARAFHPHAAKAKRWQLTLYGNQPTTTPTQPTENPLADAAKTVLMRELREFADMPAHQPNQPSWLCKTCLLQWPCETRRTELLVARGDDKPWLIMYMSLYLNEAVTDLCIIPSDLGPIVKRFLGWLTGPTADDVPNEDIETLIARLEFDLKNALAPAQSNPQPGAEVPGEAPPPPSPSTAA